MPRDKSKPDYDRVIGTLFQKKIRSTPNAEVVDFVKDELQSVCESLGIVIKNLPDVKYTYDSRRPFPPEISKTGDWAIIGRGKGLYSFIKLSHSNLIRLPADVEIHNCKLVEIPDGVPEIIRGVLGEDEQATLARILYADIMKTFTGCSKMWRIQGHERTTVSAGQIEVDEVYVGIDESNKKYVFPISAKGGTDCLSYTQAYSLCLYASEKDRYTSWLPRPLGICKTSEEKVYIIEFSYARHIQDIKILRASCYKFLIAMNP